MHAVIPLKGFAVGKARLAPSLDNATRSRLARAVALHVADACAAAGFDITVVSSDEKVTEWAQSRGALLVADPGAGLDAACSLGVSARSTPWVVVHGDLPLLDAATMRQAAAALQAGRDVIAASRDGGTNLLGSHGSFDFSYGVASFHRHLARFVTPPQMITTMATLVELDTPSDLESAARLPGGAWLGTFLT
jgi:2-phospho-L-lactate guanylyltransferase